VWHIRHTWHTSATDATARYVVAAQGSLGPNGQQVQHPTAKKEASNEREAGTESRCH